MLVASLPKRSRVECADVVRIMTLAGQAGRLVRIQPAHHIRSFVVLRLFFVGPHSGMAVQTFAVVKG